MKVSILCDYKCKVLDIIIRKANEMLEPFKYYLKENIKESSKASLTTAITGGILYAVVLFFIDSTASITFLISRFAVMFGVCFFVTIVWELFYILLSWNTIIRVAKKLAKSKNRDLYYLLNIVESAKWKGDVEDFLKVQLSSLISLQTLDFNKNIELIKIYPNGIMLFAEEGTAIWLHGLKVTFSDVKVLEIDFDEESMQFTASVPKKFK